MERADKIEMERRSRRGIKEKETKNKNKRKQFIKKFIFFIIFDK